MDEITVIERNRISTNTIKEARDMYTWMKKTLAVALAAAMLLGTAATALASRGDIVDGFGDLSSIEPTVDIYADSNETLIEPIASEDESEINRADWPIVPKGSLNPIYIQTREVPAGATLVAEQFFNDVAIQALVMAQIHTDSISAMNMCAGFTPYNAEASDLYYFPVAIGSRFELLILVTNDPAGGYTASIAPDELVTNLNQMYGASSPSNPISIVATENGFASVSANGSDVRVLEIFEDSETTNAREVMQEIVSEAKGARLPLTSTDTVVTLSNEEAKEYVGNRNVLETVSATKRLQVKGVTNGTYGSRGMCWAACSMSMYASYKDVNISFTSVRTRANKVTGKTVGTDGFSAKDAADILKDLGVNVTYYRSFSPSTDSKTLIDKGRIPLVPYGSDDDRGHAVVHFGYGYGNDTGRLIIYSMDPNAISTELRRTSQYTGVGQYISFDRLKTNKAWQLHYASSPIKVGSTSFYSFGTATY